MFGERLFGLDAQTLFDAAVLCIDMFILFFFLSYKMFNPVRDLLNRRKEKIENDRKQAETDKLQAAKLREEYEARLKEIDKEAENILSETRQKALKNQDRITNEAKEEAGRIIAHAKSEAELEKKKVTDEVKREIIEVATLMAGKVAKASVDQKTQEALVDETLREIGDSTWLS